MDDEHRPSDALIKVGSFVRMTWRGKVTRLYIDDDGNQRANVEYPTHNGMTSNRWEFLYDLELDTPSLNEVYPACDAISDFTCGEIVDLLNPPHWGSGVCKRVRITSMCIDDDGHIQCSYDAEDTSTGGAPASSFRKIK